MLRSVSLFQRSNRNLVDRLIESSGPGDTSAAPFSPGSRRAGTGLLEGALTGTAALPPVDAALAALREHASALGIGDVAGLQPTETGEWAGLRLVWFQQALAGIPVYGAEILVGCDEGGSARVILSDWDPLAWEFLHTPLRRDVTVDQALEIALADLGLDSGDLVGALQPSVVV